MWKMKRKKCRVQCLLNLISVRNVPLPAENANTCITDRLVRICLFDGKKFVSNIVMIMISEVDHKNGAWVFNNQANSGCKEFSELFLRTDDPSVKIAVLFELSILFDTPAGPLELSCGWSVLNLFEESGTAAANKTHKLYLKGGTPFEKNVTLSQGLENIRASRFSLSNIVNALKNEPHLIVELTHPSKKQLSYLETLPDTLIAQTTHLLYMHFFRRSLFTHFHTHNPSSIEPIHSPMLSSFIRVASRPDLMDVLRMSWSERFKSMARSEKKSIPHLLSLFESTFMDHIYPLIHLAHLQGVKSHSVGAWKFLERETKAAMTSGFSDDKLSGIDLMAKPGQAPFDTIELTFNPCIPGYA